MKKSFLIFICSVFMACLGFEAEAQVQMRNLPKFDKRKYHFGMILGINSSTFYLDRNPVDSLFADSLLGISPVQQGGFDIHMLASWDFSENFRLRFTPGLSFQDRGLEYSRLNRELGRDLSVRRTESVFLEFPLLLKMRTDRVGNFAAYALVGGKYGIDMQTQSDSESVSDPRILKISRNDFAIEAGGGFDFFLPFFKLGLELKTAIGLNNMLIDEGEPHTAPINSLRTRAVMFSVTFEG